MIALLPLHSGAGHKQVVVDHAFVEEDQLSYLSQFKWGLTKKRYAITSWPTGQKLMLHRVVYRKRHGIMPTQLDHIDRNPLNNLLSNLRVATSSENNANRGKYHKRHKVKQKYPYNTWVISHNLI